MYINKTFQHSEAFNSTIRRMLMNKESPDCSLSVIAMCQEGMTMVKNFRVELDNGIINFTALWLHCISQENSYIANYVSFHFITDLMYCDPPKTSLMVAMDKAKQKLRIENEPVIILLVLLGFNILLYILLLPCCVSIVN